MVLSSKGVTLLELMVTILIIAIMLVLAAPGANRFIINGVADRISRELELDLNYARSQATTLNQIVEFEPVQNWQGGWKITAIHPQTNIRTVLRERTHELEPNSISSPTINTNSPLKFSSNGRTANDAKLTISIPHCSGNRIRTFVINRIGQIQLSEAKQCS